MRRCAGRAAIKFAIAAGHFVIALVRRGGSLSVEGLASEETLKVIEVDFDALDHARFNACSGSRRLRSVRLVRLPFVDHTWKSAK
jgi:hypothetical protein